MSKPNHLSLMQRLGYIPKLGISRLNRRNMRGNSERDAALIRAHRSMIKNVNSQLEKMGLQHLHARTTRGVALTVLAYLMALALINVNQQSR